VRVNTDVFKVAVDQADAADESVKRVGDADRFMVVDAAKVTNRPV
jgi:hypothetical protein